MIPENIMGRLMNSASVQERWLVQLDVLSVYLLQHLNQIGMLNHMCFKGGISLRKVFARTPSRFSRDVDFVDISYQQLSDGGITAEEYYYKLLNAFDGQTIHDIHWKVGPIVDDEPIQDTLRVDLHFFVYDDKPEDGWENRSDNVLSIECSFRRPVLLPTQQCPLREESWFKLLEFTPSLVPVFQPEEAIAEKIRAAFQRNNARDIFDLNQYGQLAFNEELVRTMAVLKCWQDRGMYAGPKNFDAEELLSKLQVDKYSWERLKSQVSSHAWIDPPILLQKIKTRYAFLRQLTKPELELCLDRGKKKNLLHDELWKNCRRLNETK
jgi:predicted nucleotidyltransferase component of viral defense system